MKDFCRNKGDIPTYGNFSHYKHIDLYKAKHLKKNNASEVKLIRGVCRHGTVR